MYTIIIFALLGLIGGLLHLKRSWVKGFSTHDNLEDLIPGLIQSILFTSLAGLMLAAVLPTKQKSIIETHPIKEYKTLSVDLESIRYIKKDTTVSYLEFEKLVSIDSDECFWNNFALDPEKTISTTLYISKK
jgi:hypothetical protein